MKRVLIYGNRKSDITCYDASTDELAQKAFWTLFKVIDKDWECYEDLKDFDPDEGDELGMTYEQIEALPAGSIKDKALDTFREYQAAGGDRDTTKLHAEWYEKAKKGDYKALMSLLKARRTWEYEEWQLVEVTETK